MQGEDQDPAAQPNTDPYDSWVHQSLGSNPAQFAQEPSGGGDAPSLTLPGSDPVAMPGGPVTPALTLGLTSDETARCKQFLETRTEVVVKPGGVSARQEDYQPTLDGNPSSTDDIVAALMQNTSAGFSAANGGDTTGPLYTGTLSQVSELVNRRIQGLTIERAQAALKLPPPSLNDAAPNDVAMVSRADVQSILTTFLQQVMKEQKGTAVRITEPVRLAAQALTKGMAGASTGIAASLGLSSPGDPGQLAAHICKQLPDQIPRANVDGLQALSPKEVSAPNQSAGDALAGLVSKEVNAVVGLLPKDWQDSIKGAVADAIAAGIAAIAEQAMSDSPLDDKTKKAIQSAVEAAIKQKERGPPMDRKQDGEGSPDANPPPPPNAPPPQADPKPPAVPEEKIYNSPALKTPDQPPERPKPQEAAGPGGGGASEEQGGDQPEAPAATGRTIGVTIKTSYSETVRYWIQDLAIDHNTMAAQGSGTDLVTGDEHGPDDAIALSCTEMANGAAVCYRRESYPNPPGGGMTDWTTVRINEGDTATMIL